MSKRARGRTPYGTGSVYQRKSDGRWCGQIVVGTRPDGKPDRRYVYGDSEKEVYEKLDDLKHLQRLNQLPLPNRVTVKEYADRWLNLVARTGGQRRNGLAENTVAVYRNALEYTKSAYGDVLLRDLTGTQLADLYLKMQQDGLSVRQRELVHKVTGQMLRAAMKERFITRDVTNDVPYAPKAEYDDPRALTRSEVSALLSAAKGTKWEVAFQLAIDAALGRGELLGVTLSHVDLTSGTLAVEQQVLRRKDEPGLAVRQLKTRARRRYPKLSRPTIELLRWWMDELKRMLQVDILPRHAFLFPGGHWRKPDPYRPMSPEGVQDAFERYCEKAGIVDVTFHNLRATAATWMAEEGVPPKTAARRLGHSNVKTLLEFYTRVQERSEGMAADVMGALFDSNVDSSFPPRNESGELTLDPS